MKKYKIIKWKALDLDTPVYSKISDRGEKYPKKTIGDLEKGDFIYDESGKLTEVLHLNPIIFDNIYEVEFEDGEIIECNADHLWGVYDRNFLQRKDEKILCERSTDFLYNNFKFVNKDNNKKIEYRFHVPCNKPIEYPNIQNLTIDPYVLGVWLGDGSHSTNQITSHVDDVDEMCKILTERGAFATKKETNRDSVYQICIDREMDFLKNGENKSNAKSKSFLSKIKKMDLYKNKHIPERYLYATIEERLLLLQGLMDTDGTVDKYGHCEFTQTRYPLIKQVSQLLSSLGIKNNIIYKEIPTYLKKNGECAYTYRINFRTDKSLPCFRLKRKYDRLPEKTSHIVNTKAIVDVRKTNKKKPMRCITVSNDSGLFLCGDKFTVTHNSYLAAPYIMTRSILIPNHATYIMCPAGTQAQETFTKIEDLAKCKIQSVSGATKVFWDELIKAGTSDGFVHDKNSYHCELFNGSTINTLNSNPKTIVGMRSYLNFYDEAGKIDRDFFALTKPFLSQDMDFITGKDINVNCYPRQFPTQMIYSSSAEGMDSELYDQYKDCALRMIAGFSDCFVCDISCEFSLHPMLDGKPYRPLLSQEVVDEAFRANEYRATREYYNKFDISGGQDALVKRTTLIANSKAFLPVYNNEDNSKTYIIAYDPASKLDNSFVLIGELFEDSEKGWMVKLVNAINLVELTQDGKKKIIQKPEQIERIKQLILDYNGSVPDYDNIQRIIIDAGSGGGGFDISQFLLKNWIGTDGREHRGLIDLEDKYLKEEKNNFPSALNKLTLANFTSDKVKMYTACQDMINQGLVIFPKSLNLKNEMEFEYFDSDNNLIIKTEHLDTKEVKSITEIDLLKEELVAMQKTVVNGTTRFDTLPSKKNQGMHDDRSDCCAMICKFLADLRKNSLLQTSKPKGDGFNKLFQHGKKMGMNQQNRMNNGMQNPFAREASHNPFL